MGWPRDGARRPAVPSIWTFAGLALVAIAVSGWLLGPLAAIVAAAIVAALAAGSLHGMILSSRSPRPVAPDETRIGSDTGHDHSSPVRLQGANLRNALLSGADLRSADLRGAEMSGADLEGADLRNAKLGPL